MCISPFFRVYKGNQIPLPCGRCPPCKKRRVDGWVFRLMQEYKVSSSAHFVTLTYDPEHVPISEHGFMTLDKSEFPRYMKRLRKIVPRGTILKYYACGEYGSKNSRPHYHAIIFNCPKDEFFFDVWSLGGVHFGGVNVGQVTQNSVAYTMKYIDKSVFKSRHSRDDRVPEFALMSKGLGQSFVTPAIKSFYKADLSRNFLTRDGGYKIAMPRYYRERVFDEDERAAQGIFAYEAACRSYDENYALYLKVCGSDSVMDYGQFVDSQRQAAVNSFYNNQKLRDV